jgi:ABC-type Fe3+ transport system substrate-binding protein
MKDMCMRHSTKALAVAFALAGAGAAHAADAALIEAAKKDGRVVWYSTQIINQLVAPASVAFEKKYGVKVDYVRADSTEVLLRITNEAKAGRVEADVFDTASPASFIKAGLAGKYKPDSAKTLAPELYDPDGYWTATNIYVHTAAYNTNLAPPGTQPKSFADFLDPKWKGKMAWAARPTTSAAPGFIGLVLMAMGEQRGMDYLRALAKQNIAPLTVSARQLVDQTMAGEYAIALHINDNHAAISKQQGAPVDWIPLDPSIQFFSVIGMTAQAQHPNAAKLLIDFLVSSEGQQLFREADYIPVDPQTPPRDPALRPDGVKFKALSVSPNETDAAVQGWWKIYQDVFR